MYAQQKYYRRLLSPEYHRPKIDMSESVIFEFLFLILSSILESWPLSKSSLTVTPAFYVWWLNNVY